MLGLFGNKSDHPLSDPKSVQQVVDELPKTDSSRALQELTTWVNSLQSGAPLRLDMRFAILNRLDQAGNPHEARVLREYLSLGANAPVPEKRLWKVLNEYYAGLAEAYADLLSSCRDGEKGADAIKDQRPLIVARGISAMTGYLKCLAVHYEPVMDVVWEQLTSYYEEAESQRCLDTPIELYPGVSVRHTIRYQLAAMLMWWAAGTGSLKPAQTHIAERLALHVSRGFTFGSEAGEDALYQFDLTKHRPPARYDGDAVHPNLRFLGYGKVKLLLEPLIIKLEKGDVPEGLNLGGSYDAAMVLEQAKRLFTNWLTTPPARRNARRSLNVRMDVAPGFAGLLDVTGNEPETGKRPSWVAEDVSATGFRCVLDATQGKSIRIGSLLGYRPENVSNWGVGIVRRLRRDDDGNLDVGVEVLSSRAARLSLDGGAAVSSSGSFAIWLGQSGGEARMLLKLGHYNQTDAIAMRLGNRQYMMLPQELQEKGDDYELARYRLQEREGNG